MCQQRLYLALLYVCLCINTGFAQTAGRGPSQPQDTSPDRCRLDDTSLQGTVELRGECRYEQGFEIDEPDVVLNCNGATISPDSGYAVNIKRNADRAIVRDCYMNGEKGIAVRVRRLRDGESDDDVRDLAAENVVIERVHVSESTGVGIHILPHTVGVTVRDSIIIDNSSAGLYLSPYGKRHQIINNLIENNGHIKPDGVPRIGWYRREGIAVDGSSEHVIRGNDINDNAFGGIFLFKNCWEHAADEPNSRPRTEYASDNVITDNHFRDQPFGIWVAARQSRDLTQMECGDPTPYNNPISVTSVFHSTYADYPSANVELYLLSLNFASVFPDFAKDNIIRGNVFENIIRGGVRIEDDGTEVRDNLFIGDFDFIFVGAPFRARLNNEPVRDTVITDNSFAEAGAAEFRTKLALIPEEHVDTQVSNNFRACQRDDGTYARHGETSSENALENCGDERTACNDGQWQTSRVEDGCEPPEPGTDTDASNMIDAQDLGVDSAMDSTTLLGADVGVSDADAGPSVGDNSALDVGMLTGTSSGGGVGRDTTGGCAMEPNLGRDNGARSLLFFLLLFCLGARRVD
ncbi:MAG: right-handed parallel beta-helix repeat-containing protein [Bradymonadia bacterium]